MKTRVHNQRRSQSVGKGFAQHLVLLGNNSASFSLACAITAAKDHTIYGIDIASGCSYKLISCDASKKESHRTLVIRTECTFRFLRTSQYIVIVLSEEERKNLRGEMLKPTAEALIGHLRKGHILLLDAAITQEIFEEAMLSDLEKNGLKVGVDFEVIFFVKDYISEVIDQNVN
jgi:hypothetical protein